MATGSWDDYKDNQKVFFEDRLYYVVRDKKELKRFVKNDLKMVIKNKVYESDRIITTRSGMFASSEFNGDISMWNVSNVLNMESMFKCSKFKNDISL